MLRECFGSNDTPTALSSRPQVLSRQYLIDPANDLGKMGFPLSTGLREDFWKFC